MPTSTQTSCKLCKCGFRGAFSALTLGGIKNPRTLGSRDPGWDPPKTAARNARAGRETGRDAGRELSTISSLDQEVTPKILPQNLQTHEHPLFTPGVGTVLDPPAGPWDKGVDKEGTRSCSASPNHSHASGQK